MNNTNEDIEYRLKELPKCGAEAMAQGNSAYIEHIQTCKSCRMPFLINNITPRDIEAYLISKS